MNEDESLQDLGNVEVSGTLNLDGQNATAANSAGGGNSANSSPNLCNSSQHNSQTLQATSNTSRTEEEEATTTSIDEAISACRLTSAAVASSGASAHAQARTVMVPASAMVGANSQPAIVAAAALGIPVSLAYSAGGTLRIANGTSIVTGGNGGSSGNVLMGRRLLLQVAGGSERGGRQAVLVQQNAVNTNSTGQQQQQQQQATTLLVPVQRHRVPSSVEVQQQQQQGSSGSSSNVVGVGGVVDGRDIVTTSSSSQGNFENQLVSVSSCENTQQQQTSLVPTRVVILPQQIQQHLQQQQQDEPESAAGNEADNAAAAAAATAANAAQNDLAPNHNNNNNNEDNNDSAATADAVNNNNNNNNSNSTMIDTTDSRMFDPSCSSYTTLTSPHNGRMTPTSYVAANSYATLTPLQPLPPISTISSMQDKFQAYSPGHSNVAGAFVMQNNLPNISLGSPYSYEKQLGMSPPPYHGHNGGGMNLQQSHSPSALSPPQGSYPQNGLHSKQEPLSPNAAGAAYYDPPGQRPSPHDLSPPHSIDTHSPTNGNNHAYNSQALSSNNNPTLNGGLTSVSPQTIC